MDLTGNYPHGHWGSCLLPGTDASWPQVPLGLGLVTWSSTVLRGLLPPVWECTPIPKYATKCVDLQCEAWGRHRRHISTCREESCWSQHNSFNCCLLSSPVFQQPRTHFARSSALLNVLWQHLVEQGKNCTAPWRKLLCLLISLQGKAFWWQRFALEGSRGVPSESPPLGWHQHCAGLISAVFLCTLPSRKQTLLYRQEPSF